MRVTALAAGRSREGSEGDQRSQFVLAVAASAKGGKRRFGRENSLPGEKQGVQKYSDRENKKLSALGSGRKPKGGSAEANKPGARTRIFKRKREEGGGRSCLGAGGEIRSRRTKAPLSKIWRRGKQTSVRGRSFCADCLLPHSGAHNFQLHSSLLWGESKVYITPLSPLPASSGGSSSQVHIAAKFISQGRRRWGRAGCAMLPAPYSCNFENWPLVAGGASSLFPKQERDAEVASAKAAKSARSRD